MVGETLYDKLWNEHRINSYADGSELLYVDRHFIHEVTSPQAFEGLTLNDRKLWRVNANLAVPDHNVPTERHHLIENHLADAQIKQLEVNCQRYHIPHIPVYDERQGIIHVIGPEQGATLPGMVIACADSHTATHGALAALGFGIGASDVEHVLATQCLRLRKLKTMRIEIDGYLPKYISAKDVILAIIRKIGCMGAAGFAIEYSGDVVRQMSIESRMTLCNMSIEAGSRIGLVAVDAKTVAYLEGRPYAPKGMRWQQAQTHWQNYVSDDDAKFDYIETFDCSNLAPHVSWGTSPDMVIPINETLPACDDVAEAHNQQAIKHALDYMGLSPGMSLSDVPIDRVFIGSCTNARIEDIRAAAAIIRHHRIHQNIKQALLVPGSGVVKRQAEAEGLDEIFLKAGFEWRDPGCSMCIAMNADRLFPQERCASTSNRNYEGRQGVGGRTHLMSPAMAAAAAVAGHIVDVRTLV